jgi:hypothetical protein
MTLSKEDRARLLAICDAQWDPITAEDEQAIRAALSALDERDAEVERLTRERDHWMERGDKYRDERNAALAQVEALRGLLGEASPYVGEGEHSVCIVVGKCQSKACNAEELRDLLARIDAALGGEGE